MSQATALLLLVATLPATPGAQRPWGDYTEAIEVRTSRGSPRTHPLLELGETAVTGWNAARAVFRGPHVGDTVRVAVLRNGTPWRTTVAVTGYERPMVRIEPIPDATERQRALRARWLAGMP